MSNSFKLIESIQNNLNEEEFDNNGMQKLETPYYMTYDEEKEISFIKSSHPYDNTDYSYAYKMVGGPRDNWIVCDYNNGKPYKVGIVETVEEAIDLMKELDSKKEANISKD